MTPRLSGVVGERQRPENHRPRTGLAYLVTHDRVRHARPATTGRRAANRSGPDTSNVAARPQPTSPSPWRTHDTSSSGAVCGSSASSAPGSGMACVRTTNGDPLGRGVGVAAVPGRVDIAVHSTAAYGGPRDSGPPTALRHNGAVNRASLDKDPSDVALMFDDVAARYDLTNDVLSLGQDRLWRRATITAARLRTRGPRPRHRRRHGDQLEAAGRRRRRRRAGRLLARHAAGRSASSSRHAVHGRRRDAPAVRRRVLRRRHDVLRPAQRRRPGRRPARVPPRHQARRPPGRLRVQPPGERRRSARSTSATSWRALPRVARRVSSQPRLLRLPRRVDPGVAARSASSPGPSRAPVGTTSPGATSAAASSRCTAPPPESVSPGPPPG